MNGVALAAKDLHTCDPLSLFSRYKTLSHEHQFHCRKLLCDFNFFKSQSISYPLTNFKREFFPLQF